MDEGGQDVDLELGGDDLFEKGWGFWGVFEESE
jgi:hypothetical protein